MKLLPTTLAMTVIAAAPAAASSFVMLKQAETQPSPSIILFVEPGETGAAAGPELLGARAEPDSVAQDFVVPMPPPDRFERISSSIIAIGEPEVEFTTVASIGADDRPPRNPHLPPMVIRGGMFGDLFVRGDGMSGSIVPSEGAPAVSAAAGSPAGPPSAPAHQPEQPKAPPQQPVAPAAPTRLPE